jgi:hypothetical protein
VNGFTRAFGEQKQLSRRKWSGQSL